MRDLFGWVLRWWSSGEAVVQINLCGFRFIESTYQATEDNQTAVLVEPTYEKWEVSING